MKYIDTEENCFIVVDIDSGYWKVVAEEEARKILSFFTRYGNQRGKLIPMWALNVAPTFVVMVMKLKMEWYTLAK